MDSAFCELIDAVLEAVAAERDAHDACVADRCGSASSSKEIHDRWGVAFNARESALDAWRAAGSPLARDLEH